MISWTRATALITFLSLVCAVPVFSICQAQSSPNTALGSHAVPPPEARTDINHASLEELVKVPGMTQTWAARIIRYRPYRSKQDLLDRGILSSGVYDRVKDFLIAHRSAE